MEFFTVWFIGLIIYSIPHVLKHYDITFDGLKNIDMIVPLMFTSSILILLEIRDIIYKTNMYAKLVDKYFLLKLY